MKFYSVMRGLDARIHPVRKSLSKSMDCRVKPAMTPGQKPDVI